MRPFSAFNYIRHNKLRCIVLALMMSFITSCFIGGMYVDNTSELFRISLQDSNQFLLIGIRGTSNDAIEEYHELQANLPQMLPEEAKEILYVNHYYTSFDSIVQFNCTIDTIGFQNEEQFALFKERTNLVPDDVVLHDGEYALSQQLANNKGLKPGDPLKADSPYTVASVFEKTGMHAFRVHDDQKTDCMLILGNDENLSPKLHEDLDMLARRIEAEYPHVYTTTNTTLVEDVEGEMSFMIYIFYAIVVVLAVVLLVTINAAFTAAFDRRKSEFALYKALGFTRWQIFRKITSEVLILNGIGIVFGSVLNAAVILVANQVLWSSGQKFLRVSQLALQGTVIAEVVITMLIILLNVRKVRKCEVTEE